MTRSPALRWRSKCFHSRRPAPSLRRRRPRFPSGSAATAITTTGTLGFAMRRWRSRPLSVLGDIESAERYLSWLAQLASSTKMALQVLYRVDGGTDIEQRERRQLAGYCGSRPVRFGNDAFRQRQIDCFGYLADCAVIYLIQAGRWAPEYWQLIRRITDYTVENWRKPRNVIWERD